MAVLRSIETPYHLRDKDVLGEFFFAVVVNAARHYHLRRTAAPCCCMYRHQTIPSAYMKSGSNTYARNLPRHKQVSSDESIK
eukprot:scaffold73434_cov23-Prasinocladus_malaysianus.AAC.1